MGFFRPAALLRRLLEVELFAAALREDEVAPLARRARLFFDRVLLALRDEADLRDFPRDFLAFVAIGASPRSR